MKAFHPSYKYCFLMFLITISMSAANYNLTLILQASLTMPLGFQLLQSQTNYPFIICTIANQTHFQVKKYNLMLNFIQADSSIFFQSYIDLSFDKNLNPNFYMTLNTVIVVFKVDTNIGGQLLQIQLNNFYYYGLSTINYYFIGVYIKNADAFYYKDEIGNEGLWDSFSTNGRNNQLFTYSYSRSSPNPTGFQVFLSPDKEQYIVTLDKINNFITISELKYSGNLVQSISRQQIRVSNGGILSACFNQIGQFFIHSADMYIRCFDHNLSPKDVIFVGQSLGKACYYDSSLQSLIYLNNNNASSSITMSQYSMNSMIVMNSIVINNTKILFSGQYAIHLGSINTLSVFNIKSCGSSYIASNYSCQNGCQSNCASCSVNFYCKSCLPSYNALITSSNQGIIANVCQTIICPSNCISCSNLTFCTTCSANFSIGIDGLCSSLICPSNCMTCFDPNICINCSSNYIANNNGTCELLVCPSNCITCLNLTLCINCVVDHVLGSNGTCIKTYQNMNSTSLLQKFINQFTNKAQINSIFSFPSARSILRPILCYFACLDDLFPYMYHERQYGNFMRNIFSTIHQMEIQKWDTYDERILDPLLEKIDTNKNNLTNSLDTYYNYSSPTFVMWEGNGETFFVSILSFATSNFAISLVVFTVFFIFFKLLFRYKVSVNLRSYSFWPYFIFFLMEGNLQMLTFYACSVLKLNFYFNASQKLQTAIAYFILFFIVVFAVGGYLTVYFSFKKLAKYFSDNVHISFETVLFLTIDLGLKNFLMGLVHSLFRKTSLYGVQFSCLAAIELMCLVNYVYFLRLNKMFEFKLKIWLFFWLSLLRLCFIFLLFLRIHFYGIVQVAFNLQQPIKCLISVYFYTTIMGTFLNIFYLLAKILCIGILQKCSCSKASQDTIPKIMIPEINLLKQQTQMHKKFQIQQIKNFVIKGEDFNKFKNKIIIKCDKQGKHMICRHFQPAN